MKQGNILDPVHDCLDESVFDDPCSPEPKLKQYHAKWILRTINDVLKKNGYTHMEEWLSVVFTGSLTTYQYSPDSDCDVSLFVDTQHFPDWSRAEMIGIMVGNIDSTKLPGTTHDMQCYVVPKDIAKEQLYQPGLRSGYDIQSQTWIVPPEKGRVHNVETEMHSAYVYALEQADKMQKLLEYEPDKAILMWHHLHKRRQRDMRAGRGDYSESNIVYKMLNNRGLFPAIAQASGEYIAKVAGTNIKVEYPQGYEHPYRGGWQDEPWTDEDRQRMQTERTPFWVAQHKDDLDDHRIFLGTPGAEHMMIHIPEDYVERQSGSIKPSSWYGHDDGTVETERYNLFSRKSDNVPPYDPEYDYPEDDPNVDRYLEYHDNLWKATHEKLKSEFPELPWKQRDPWKFSAIQPFFVDERAVEKARQHLGLNLPVKVNPLPGATSGGYVRPDEQNPYHEVQIASWLRPETASRQIWHELSHARDYEQNPEAWDQEEPNYRQLREQSHEDYLQHPWEVSAHALADSHPFSLALPRTSKVADVIPEHTKAPNETNLDIFGTRYPIIYQPDVRDPYFDNISWEDRPEYNTPERLLIGKPGQTHSEVEQELPALHSGPTYHGAVEDNRFRWLGNAAPNHAKIMQALAQEFPGVEELNSNEKWYL